MYKTRGSNETETRKALIQWQKEYLGRGPIAIKTDILRDLVIVILRGILTPAEYGVKIPMLVLKRGKNDHF